MVEHITIAYLVFYILVEVWEKTIKIKYIYIIISITTKYKLLSLSADKTMLIVARTIVLLNLILQTICLYCAYVIIFIFFSLEIK